MGPLCFLVTLRDDKFGREVRTMVSDALPPVSRLDPRVRPDELSGDILALERSVHLVLADHHGTITIDVDIHFGWRQVAHHIVPFREVSVVVLLASALPEMVDARVIVGQILL